MKMKPTHIKHKIMCNVSYAIVPDLRSAEPFLPPFLPSLDSLPACEVGVAAVGFRVAEPSAAGVPSDHSRTSEGVSQNKNQQKLNIIIPSSASHSYIAALE